MKTLRSILFASGLATALALALSGCGRKADLDPPSLPKEQQNNRGVKTDQKVSDKPFLLDPLL